MDHKIGRSARWIKPSLFCTDLGALEVYCYFLDPSQAFHARISIYTGLEYGLVIKPRVVPDENISKTINYIARFRFLCIASSTYHHDQRSDWPTLFLFERSSLALALECNETSSELHIFRRCRKHFRYPPPLMREVWISTFICNLPQLTRLDFELSGKFI